MKLAKRFTIDKVRLRVDFDLYNVFNSSWPYTVTTTYSNAATGTWQRPTNVLQHRFFKLGGNIRSSYGIRDVESSGKTSRATHLGLPAFSCTGCSPRRAAAQHAPHAVPSIPQALLERPVTIAHRHRRRA